MHVDNDKLNSIEPSEAARLGVEVLNTLQTATPAIQHTVVVVLFLLLNEVRGNDLRRELERGEYVIKDSRRRLLTDVMVLEDYIRGELNNAG